MYFMDTICFIEGNDKLRIPQVEAYMKIQEHFRNYPEEEALVVLPTGTGKTGLISIAPFGVSEGRVLIITPGTVTKDSISKSIEILEDNFWINQEVIFDLRDLPVVIEYGNDVWDEDLEASNFVYANIQKMLKANENSLIKRVPRDFFDMIIVDEAHHAPAKSWRDVLKYFNKAKVLHVTGTPYRGDGVQVPGKVIHETSLSEVMEAKYVKWLRNKTIDNDDIYFIDKDNNIIGIDEARKLHDEDWVNRSVAMSDECSLEVVKSSIEELNRLKSISPNVPHKIMASACTIKHAETITELYRQEGMTPILIHSDLEENVKKKRFKQIELNECNVVVNVSMMGEGYDHKYLTICTLFRPYKSLNMFAQIIGRVLRAIPEGEITKHEIDNNALIIYHKQLGLENLWNYFKEETILKSKYDKIKEIEFSDKEYEERNILYGEAKILGNRKESIDSYSDKIDFNEKFEQAKKELEYEVDNDRKKLKDAGFEDEAIEEMLEVSSRRKSREKSKELEEIYNEKRPVARRKLIKSRLTKKIGLLAIELLEEANIEEKGNELYQAFKPYLPKYINSNTKNDGVLVVYINTKLKIKFGGRDVLDIRDLTKAEEELKSISNEIRRMVK